ncbi:MAG TPA: hypothetical protein VFN96_02610 [Gemmatimonadales bacterium]|nr:hypothetical protein [Gemmatimonadales bacterium]
MLPLLILLQAVPVSGAGGEARLDAVLTSAEQAVRTAAIAPGGWTATMETEVATLGRREGRIEGATLLEQTSSSARWSSAGGFEQHVLGSRSFPNAIPLSRLAFLQIGWCVPSLFGERILVISRTGPRNMGYDETMQGPMAPVIVVHPLASDRARYYTYAGSGSPVRIRLPGWTADRDVYRVEIIPRTDLDREETLFEGEMVLDAESRLPLRLFGRIRTIGGTRDGGFLGLGNLPEMFEPTVTLVDLVNQPVAGGGWAPLHQRFEIETASSLASGYGAARRVITQFHEVEALDSGGAGPVAIGASTFGYILTAASRDSLRSFRGWFSEEGEATRAASRADFQRFRPDRLQPTGRPILLLEGSHSGDFLRINRVEGPFTGLALTWRLRDAAPGLMLRAKAGRAWSEDTFRGGGALGWSDRRWALELAGGRSLDPTNKFRNQFDNPAMGALISHDNWDYVDRWSGGLSVTRTLTHDRGSILRLELGGARDQAVSRHMDHALLGGFLRRNRGIFEGDYLRGRLLFDWNPDVSPVFARDGIGTRVEIEHGAGDLDYTRVEARVVARKTFRKAFIVTRLHGGATFSDAPPPQQLFELGGPAGLPGYEYKEFAGDRAALLRTRVSVPLGFLDIPFRVGSWLTLPSLSPAISVGGQAAITDASDAAAAASVGALGFRYDEKADTLLLDPQGDPLPASTFSSKVHSSVDIRIGFFGDALGFGVARALERGRKTEFFVAFGRQF